MATNTRHLAYAVTSTGRVSRHPFASMPTAAALRWVAAHPDERVRWVPELPAAEAECLDCHATIPLAWVDDTSAPRCPGRSGGGHRVPRDVYDAWAEDEDDTLGPCGCTDYHMADCPTRTGYADALSRDEYDEYDV